VISRLQFFRDLFAFARTGRRAWLVPIVIILLLVSLLAAIGALAPYVGFLYPL
jgi:hypothetical protein